MTVISLASCTGSPGVTATALATAAGLLATEVYEPVMVELARSGGVVASQYDLPAEPGLTSLALALGGEPPDILDHAQELPGGLPVVMAPPSGTKTSKLIDAKSNPLGRYLQDVPATVVADCGRISATDSLLPVLEHSTLIGLVVKPSREAFHLAATVVAELDEQTELRLPIGWVLAGPCPWTHDEIVGQYGLPVLGIMADDPIGAEAAAGLRRFRRRSPLARSAQSFADDIAKHLRVATVSAPLGYLDQPDDVGPPKPPSPPTPVAEVIAEVTARDREADDGPVEHDPDGDGSVDEPTAQPPEAAVQ